MRVSRRTCVSSPRPTAVATIGTDVLGITDLDVASVASVSALAAALSILTSLGGLPEVPDEDTPSE